MTSDLPSNVLLESFGPGKDKRSLSNYQGSFAALNIKAIELLRTYISLTLIVASCVKKELS